MATTEDIRATICGQLGTLSSLVAVQDAADATRGALAYFVVGEAASDEPVGYPVPNTARTSILARREARIPIAAHGLAARPFLAAYLARLLVPGDALRLGLLAVGAHPVRTVGPRRSSYVYRTGHEPRWVADLIVTYDETFTGVPGVDVAVGIVVDLTSTGGGTTVSLPAAITVPVPAP
jgi:hypothetical protein